MAEMKLTERKNPDASVTTMANRFSRYAPEEEKATRKVEVAQNPALEAMKKAFTKLKYVGGCASSETLYAAAAKMVRGLKYTAKDVEAFSVVLSDFQVDMELYEPGFFLSALMNGCKDTVFVIHTAHLAEPFDYLGYKNNKDITLDGGTKGSVGNMMGGGTITVEGDADYMVGSFMHKGAIIVKGNAGSQVGYGMKGGRIAVLGNASHSVGAVMDDGTITVEGNAGDRVGFGMYGGIITVEGDAGKIVGADMEGGEIHIEGDFESIGNVIHGKVYHKGKLIVDK